MIQVSALTKYYDELKALDAVDFHIKKGEVVGFLGPNGAGKSTTMKLLTCNLTPDAGSIKIAGIDALEEPTLAKRHIGYLPETPPIYPDMQTRDFLLFAAKLKGLDGATGNKAVDEALEKTSLQDVARRNIAKLSKGYKQRIGIAQAIVANPDILILDEPTVGLDPSQVAEVRKLIQSLKGEHTILLSTHILPEVQATCERILIINKGKIILKDSLANVNKQIKGTQTYKIKTSDRIPNIHELKQISGVDIVSVEHVHDNLENIFIELTRGENR